MSRMVNVVRMQLVNRQTFVWLPLIVLGGAILVTIVIFGILKSVGVDDVMFAGAAQAPLWYFFVIGIRALTSTFPFSQAMSVTRRDFYAGTLLTAALASVVVSVVFVLGGFIERMSDGWGMNGFLFYLPALWADGPAGAGFFFWSLALVMFVAGFGWGLVHKRWGSMVLTGAICGVAIALLGLVWIITRQQAWGTLVTWFSGLGPVGVSGWLLIIAAALALLSYGTLRRTVA